MSTSTCDGARPGPRCESGSQVDVIYDKRGCAAALKRWPGLRARVAETVSAQAAAGWFKCKGATGRLWHGHKLQECRVNEAGAGSVRVAFWAQGDRAEVVYITPTLVKRDFTRELERFLAR